MCKIKGVVNPSSNILYILDLLILWIISNRNFKRSGKRKNTSSLEFLTGSLSKESCKEIVNGKNPKTRKKKTNCLTAVRYLSFCTYLLPSDVLLLMYLVVIGITEYAIFFNLEKLLSIWYHIIVHSLLSQLKTLVLMLLDYILRYSSFIWILLFFRTVEFTCFTPYVWSLNMNVTSLCFYVWNLGRWSYI